MRIAFFSPLNPRRSGISDYSEALLPRLLGWTEVDVFIEDYEPSNPDLPKAARIRHWKEFESDYHAGRYDAVLYHMGNNQFHVYIYDLALRIPGVVVLHDFNLHYLMADATIVRENWDEYLKEAEYNGGPTALAHARRAQAGEVQLEYDRVAMNRRLLETSKALIVHSEYVRNLVRRAGFTLPVEVIPHGAETRAGQGDLARRRLDVDGAPLFGAFGFLKPYKRIASIIQAFARLGRYRPDARLILVGEEHPHYPLRPLIRDLGQEDRIRILGHVPLSEFVDYIAACDVCLNLRFPTAGESSGSLLREMAAGRAVIVSDIGSFSELPAGTCIKIPAGDEEPEWLFEYMNTLVNQPELAQAMGRNAAAFIARDCAWEKTAAQYARYLGAAQPAPAAPVSEAIGDYILSFSQQNAGAESYARTHLHRMVKTLEITPPGGAGAQALEMGCYLQMTPALKRFLNYENVRGCYFGARGVSDWKVARTSEGEEFGCYVDLFDAEKDPYPYPDASYDLVLCCELLEHLYFDPMHMMGEINRILKPGGHLVLTTPNITSYRAVDATLNGVHPGFYSVYIKPDAQGNIDPRHNREYAPPDIHHMFERAGFDVVRFETEWYSVPGVAERERNARVAQLLAREGFSLENRGDVLFVVGRKSGPVKERWPRELYDQ